MSESFSYSSFFDDSYFEPSEYYAFDPEQSTASLDEVFGDPTSSNYVGPDFFDNLAEDPITTSVSEPIVQPQTNVDSSVNFDDSNVNFGNSSASVDNSNASVDISSANVDNSGVKVLEQPQAERAIQATIESTVPAQASEIPAIFVQSPEATTPQQCQPAIISSSPASDDDLQASVANYAFDGINSSANANDVIAAMPPITSNGLRFSSIDHARQFAEARTPLAVVNDDWAAMEANPQPHILKIMAAFSGKLRPEPEYYDCTEIRLADWRVYQARNLDRVDKIARSDPSRIELAAWLIFGELIDAHKQGAKPAKANTTAQPAPAPVKCSIHLDDLCQPIRDYAIFRFDLLRLTRIDELVSNVEGAKTRKLSNFKGNGRKAERDVENAKTAAEIGYDYKKVLGSKRKRGEGEGDEGMKKVKKSKKRAAAPVDENEMGFGEFAGFPGSDSFSSVEGNKVIKKMKKTTKKQAAAVDQGDMGFGAFGGLSGSGLYDPAAVGGAQSDDLFSLVGGVQNNDVFGLVGGVQNNDVLGLVGGVSVGDIGGGVKRKDSVITIE